MKIISNKQYELFLAQQGRIEQLQKENERLKSDMNERDADAFESGYIAGLNAYQKAKSIDFPNSVQKAPSLFDKLF